LSPNRSWGIIGLGPGSQEEIHAQNALDLKAIVHPTDFNLDIGDLLLADAQLPNPAGEYRFYPANTSDGI
jgi:hypothetical protein